MRDLTPMIGKETRFLHKEDRDRLYPAPDLYDGRPMSTDAFLELIYNAEVFACESVESAVRAWVEGDWDHALFLVRGEDTSAPGAQPQYQIMEYLDPNCEAATPIDACYADGYDIWERQGEGLVMKFTVDAQGQLTVDAEWPKNWHVEMCRNRAIEWALGHDVFSSDPDLGDDNAFIQARGEAAQS